MARREPSRLRRVARAFREGLPMPQVDPGKVFGARRIYATNAWADASGHVHLLMAGKGKGKKRCVTSLTRADLVRMARMRVFEPLELSYNEDIRPADLVDIVTRNVVPSKWLRKMVDV